MKKVHFPCKKTIVGWLCTGCRGIVYGGFGRGLLAGYEACPCMCKEEGLKLYDFYETGRRSGGEFFMICNVTDFRGR